MDLQREPREPWAEDRHSRPAWVTPLAILIVAIGAGLAVVIASSPAEKKTKTVIVEATPSRGAEVVAAPSRGARPEPSAEPSSAGSGGPLGAGAARSFEALAASMPAQVGLVVAPFGGRKLQEFGSLEGGHAWSTIKVPILVTLLRDRGPNGLSAEEEGWAASALSASDNEAAASLFGQIEASHGGLEGASLAVGETLAASGDVTTTVATAPPPPGAVSTYGQTEWSLGAAAQFQRALGEGCLLDPTQTSYVEGLMQEVIPEQRWGLGEAEFPPGWSVEIKGGWGPEGGASGPYLVRQSGLLRDGVGGLAVAMIAIDGSGNYEAGAADLTQIAQWLAARLGPSLPAALQLCR